MHRKPAGYPFFAIAKRHGVDYGDVLAIAHTEIDRSEQALQRSNEASMRLPWEKQGAVIMDIHAACREQTLVRQGKIDWQTGAPL